MPFLAGSMFYRADPVDVPSSLNTG